MPSTSNTSYTTIPRGGDGVGFTRMGEARSNTKKSDIKCYACRKMGHYSNECLKKEDSTTDNVVATVIEGKDGE